MPKLPVAVQNMIAWPKKRRSSSQSAEPAARMPSMQQAPHPIRPGSEGKSCPISGLFADEAEMKQGMSAPAALALAQLEADPDIAEERNTLMLKKAQVRPQKITVEQRTQAAMVILDQKFVPLNVFGGSHKANSQTRQLVRSIGGLPTLRRFTTFFYKRAFVDPHLDQFIRSHEDPHGERFATWIAEKLGDGTPWTDERRTRPRDLMQIGRQVHEVAHDRSSAHFAAWHSPKREAHKWGEHFKPDDARVWMRLHFWAAREAGLFEPQHAAFMDYYTRFVGHFISVYSSKAPPFTRDSARWSADPRNIEQYLASGNCMTDVIDKPLERELRQLPSDERLYTGSGQANPSWPYEMGSSR